MNQTTKTDPAITAAVRLPAFFDAHVHFRQSIASGVIVPQTSRCCDRAVVMPNLEPPVTDGQTVLAYRGHVMRCVGDEKDFNPLMTLYMTASTTAAEIALAAQTCGKSLAGVKIYPAAATTNSDHGVPVDWLYPRRLSPPAHFAEALREVRKQNLVLNVHGEDPTRFLLDREYSFVAGGFVEEYAKEGGRVVLEHVSSRKGVLETERLYRAGLKVACTVTLHHMTHTLDDVVGKAHHFCRPCPLQPFDRDEIRRAALNAADRPWCFLGSDSAPHTVQKKEAGCACAGCYTAPVLAEALAEEFLFGRKHEDALRHMIAFTSLNAGAFYDVPASGRMIELVADGTAREVPHVLPGNFVPWGAGRKLRFRLKGEPGWLKGERE